MRTSLTAGASLYLTLSALGQSGGQWQLPNFSDRVELTVSNPADARFTGVVIVDSAHLRNAAPNFPGTLNIAIDTARTARFLPIQIDDLTGIGDHKEVAIDVDLAPHESKRIEIYYSSTLHDDIPWPKRVHASHAFGYNQATATIESEKIGYRTYGGFFFDVQAHSTKESGLFNSVLGFARTSVSTAEGRDIVHYGNTLGLGGIYLRANGNIYSPPLNRPDYLHQPHIDDEPMYRVLASGPLRAIIEANAPHWKIGDDEVALRAIYEMRAGEEVVRAHLWIQSTRTTRVYEVGAGVLNLPSLHVTKTDHSISVSGIQDPKIGPLALGLSFDPGDAAVGQILRTVDGDNQTIRFHRSLSSNGIFEATYQFAAAWQGSGWTDPPQHLQQMLNSTREPEVSSMHHSTNPSPSALQGEPH